MDSPAPVPTCSPATSGSVDQYQNRLETNPMPCLSAEATKVHLTRRRTISKPAQRNKKWQMVEWLAAISTIRHPTFQLFPLPPRVAEQADQAGGHKRHH